MYVQSHKKVELPIAQDRCNIRHLIFLIFVTFENLTLLSNRRNE